MSPKFSPFSSVPLSPRHCLRQFIQQFPVVSRLKGNRYDVETALSQDRLPPTAFRPLGIAGWGFLSTKYRAQGKYIGFHWPTVLEGLPVIASEFPAFADLLWTMREIFQRSYSLFAELLQRKFERAGHVVLDDVDKNNPWLLDVEEEYFSKSLLPIIKEDEDILAALKSTFDATFHSFISMRETAKAARDWGFSSKEFSLLSLRDMRDRCTEISNNKATYQKMDSDLFGLLEPKTYWGELDIARQYRSKFETPETAAQKLLSVPAGVVRLDNPGVFVINFHKFLPLREPRVSIYRELYSSDLWFAAEDATLSVRAVGMAKYVNAKYSSLVDSRSGVKALFAAGSPWEGEEDVTVVLSRERFQEMHHRIRDVTGLNKRSSGKGRKSRTRPLLKRTLGLGECYFLATAKGILISPANEEEFRHLVAFTKPRHHYGTLKPSTVLRVGIQVVKGRFFYPYELLRDNKEVLLLGGVSFSESKVARESVETVLGFSRTEFRALLQAERRFENINQHRAQSMMVGIGFSSAEDAAILRYYHPWMSADDTEELKRICEGRTIAAISRRASALTLECIDSFEEDQLQMCNLPVRRYSSAVARAIKNRLLVLHPQQDDYVDEAVMTIMRKFREAIEEKKERVNDE